MSESKKTKCYIIGNDFLGCIGFAYCKEDAKRMVKDFSGYNSGYNYVKLKISEKEFKKIEDSIPSVVHTYGNKIMFSSDEECMLEAFGQYEADMSRSIVHFLENLSFVKFSKKEMKSVELLTTFLHDHLVTYMEDGIEDEEYYYNYDEIVTWYIENGLQ